MILYRVKYKFYKLSTPNWLESIYLLLFIAIAVFIRFYIDFSLTMICSYFINGLLNGCIMSFVRLGL